MAIKIQGTTAIDDNKNAIDVNPLRTFTAVETIAAGQPVAIAEGDVTSTQVVVAKPSPKVASSAQALATNSTAGVHQGSNVLFFEDGTDNALTIFRDNQTGLVYFKIVTVDAANNISQFRTPHVTWSDQVYVFDAVIVPKAGGGTMLSLSISRSTQSNQISVVSVEYNQSTYEITITSLVSNLTGITSNNAVKMYYNQTSGKTLFMYKSGANTIVSKNIAIDYNAKTVGATTSSTVMANSLEIRAAFVKAGTIGNSTDNYILLGRTYANAVSTFTPYKVVINNTDIGFTVTAGTASSTWGPNLYGSNSLEIYKVYSVNQSNNTIVLTGADNYAFQRVEINYSTVTFVGTGDNSTAISNLFNNIIIPYYMSTAAQYTTIPPTNIWFMYASFNERSKLHLVQLTLWNDSIDGTAAEERVFFVQIKVDLDTFTVTKYGVPSLALDTAAYTTNTADSYLAERLNKSETALLLDTYFTSNWYGNAMVVGFDMRFSNAESFVGISQTSASATQSVSVATAGSISNVHSGLTANKNVALSSSGVTTSIAQNESTVETIGYAISSSKVLVTKSQGDAILRQSDISKSVQPYSASTPTSAVNFNTDVLTYTSPAATSDVAKAISAKTLRTMLDLNSSYSYTELNSYTSTGVSRPIISTQPAFLYGDADPAIDKPWIQSSDMYCYKDALNPANSTKGSLVTDSPTVMNWVAGAADIGSGKVAVFVATANSNVVKTYVIDYSTTTPSLYSSNQFTISAAFGSSPEASDSSSALAWDSVNSRLLFVVAVSNTTYCNCYLLSIDPNTAVVTLVASKPDFHRPYNSVSYFSTDSLKYVPEKQCFIFTYGNGVYAYETGTSFFKMTITSTAFGTTSSANLSGNNSYARAKIFYRSDIGKVQHIDLSSNPLIFRTINIDGSTLVVDAAQYVSVPGIPYQFHSIQYIPDLPGRYVLMANDSSNQARLIPPDATATSTSWVPSTNTYWYMHNPNNHSDGGVAKMHYDTVTKRLMTFTCGSYSAGYLRFYKIDVITNNNASPYLPVNTTIISPSDAYGMQSTIETGTLYRNKAEIIPTSSTINNNRFAVFVSVSAASTNPSYVYTYRLNPVPTDSEKAVSRFVGSAHFAGYAGTPTAAFYSPLGQYGTAAFHNSPFYNFKLFRGATYYLLPGNILSLDSTAPGATKFGKYMKLYRHEASSTNMPYFSLATTN